jgi:hypothetical protein
MSFLAPGFMVFTILFVVPIAVHLIGRSRAKPRRFAAIELLMRSERRVARRTKVQKWLLLATRALAIATVPLILAKPFVEAASDLPGAVGHAQSAVIVLDDSLSMSADKGGQPLLTLAKARARKIVAALGHDADVALVLGSRGGATPVAQLTADRAKLERAIADVAPSNRATDLSGALRHAAQLLESASHAERRVYLISDLAAHGFDRDPPWAVGRGPELVPVDITDGAPAPNRAIVDLKVEPAAHLGPRGVRVSVEIANFGNAALKELPVTLRIDGRPVAKGLVDLPAHGRADKHFFHVFAKGAEAGVATSSNDETGVHDVAAELTPDVLPADDRRFARVEVRRDLRVLVIDGDPRVSRRDDEVFYLETALRPGDRDDSQLDIATITPDELGQRRLADFDVVFLCNVKAPDGEALRDFVQHGGGLFISLGDNVDVDSYNQALGNLLPSPLQAIRTVGATATDRDDGETRAGGQGQRLGRVDRNHPMLTSIAEGIEAGHKLGDAFEAARFSRYALFRPSAKESERQVPLRFADGAPAVLDGRYGDGRVLLLASSIDRDWNDLPIQPIFLPLMQQATRYLARAPMKQPEAPMVIGQRHEIPLATGDLRVEVTTPSGRQRTFGRDQVAGRRALALADLDEPGIYKVAAANADGVLRPRPQASFVVNVEAAESDPTPMTQAALAQLTSGGGNPKAVQAPRRKVELWHALGAALLLLLFGEAVLLRRK